MALSHTTSASPASNQNPVVAFAGAIVTGSTLVAYFRTGSAITLNSIDDSVNGVASWTIGTPTDNGAGRMYECRIENSGAGTPSLTFHCSAANAPRVGLAQVDNTSGAGTTDQTAAGATGTATGTLNTNATGVTAQANETVVSYFSVGGNVTFSGVSGYTQAQAEPAAPSSRASFSYLDVTSTGAQTGAISIDSSQAYIALIRTFKTTPPASTADTPNDNLETPRPSQTSRVASKSGILGQPATDIVSAAVTTTGREETDFAQKPNPRKGPRGQVVNSLANPPSSIATSSGLEETDFLQVPNKNLGPRGRVIISYPMEASSAAVTTTGREEPDFALKPNARLGPRGTTFNTPALDVPAAPPVIEGMDVFARPAMPPLYHRVDLGGHATDIVSAAITTTGNEQVDFLLKPNTRLGPRGLVLNSWDYTGFSAPAASLVQADTNFLLKPNTRLGPRGRVVNTWALDVPGAIPNLHRLFIDIDSGNLYWRVNASGNIIKRM